MDRNAIVAYLMFDELRGGVHCIFESVGCLDGLTIYHTHRTAAYRLPCSTRWIQRIRCVWVAAPQGGRGDAGAVVGQRRHAIWSRRVWVFYEAPQSQTICIASGSGGPDAHSSHTLPPTQCSAAPPPNDPPVTPAPAADAHPNSSPQYMPLHISPAPPLPPLSIIIIMIVICCGIYYYYYYYYYVYGYIIPSHPFRFRRLLPPSSMYIVRCVMMQQLAQRVGLWRRPDVSLAAAPPIFLCVESASWRGRSSRWWSGVLSFPYPRSRDGIVTRAV